MKLLSSIGAATLNLDVWCICEDFRLRRKGRKAALRKSPPSQRDSHEKSGAQSQQNSEHLVLIGTLRGVGGGGVGGLNAHNKDLIRPI